MLARSAAHNVFEVLTDHRDLKTTESPTLQLVEDLQGLGILSVVAGSSNRLAVVTDAGEAFLFSKGARRPEMIDLDGGDTTIRMVGLGSEFDVIVTDKQVWIRGESEYAPAGTGADVEDGFGQLGLSESTSLDTFAVHPHFTGEMDAKYFASIHSSRWSTIVMLDPA